MRIMSHAGLAAALLCGLSASAQAERADLCGELLAFVSKAEGDKTQAPAQAATAVQAPSQDQPRPAAGGSDAPQQSSGLSAPVTHGGAGASGPQGQAQETAPTAQANPRASQSAPAPAPAAVAGPVAPQPSAEALLAAQSAIDGKDLLACRDATQKMRRAGVNLPPALLALGALDPKLLK